MSDLDLDAIREQLADPLGPNLYDLSLEVPRLVAEVERLRANEAALLDLPTYRLIPDQIWTYVRRDDVLGVIRGD